MTLVQLYFFYHAIVITALSLVIVTRKNPVHSVIFMLVLFFHIASLYLFLNAEFIAAIQVIVYAGAILVLFLFVVLLLNLRKEMTMDHFSFTWPTGVVIAIAIFATIVISVHGIRLGPSGAFTIERIQDLTQTKAIGTVLYTKYIFPFEVASLILLVAIVGAITLAKKHLTS
jgi:NADH-quinone oxidoreductase subunit J